MSVGPPAGAGTTTVTGRAGYACADASAAHPAMTAAAATTLKANLAVRKMGAEIMSIRTSKICAKHGGAVYRTAFPRSRLRSG
jgi:hypothetical protein